MRRINKTDYGMIDAHFEFERMHNLRRLVADVRDFRYWYVSAVALTDPDPYNPLLFAQAVRPHVYLAEIDRIVVDQCRNCRTSHRCRTSSVITALDLIALDTPFRQRGAAMGTVLQREGGPVTRAAEHYRLSANFSVHKLAGLKSPGRNAEIPDVL